MDFKFSDRQLDWQKKGREFAKNWIAPCVDRLESDLDFRRELFQKMAKEQFFTLSLFHDSEAAKGDTIAYLLALKEIAKVDGGISVAMSVTNMVAEAITHYGPQEQKNYYLPKLSDGTCVPASFALTEKCAGSDPKSLCTTATIESDSYILNGDKQFITNADMSGVTIVMAKTASTQGDSVVSAFLVDRGTPGFVMTKKENKLGLLTANLMDFKLEGCRIPKSRLLGKEGKGMKIALSSLDSGRMGVAAQAIGIAEAAFEAALKHSKNREQFGAPICQQQAIAFKLADMRVQLSASHLLLWKAAWLRDQGLPYSLEASEAKLYCSEAANRIADEALQIYGGYGYVKDYPVERYFRDARVTTIYEGTSEIQRLVISRHLLNME